MKKVIVIGISGVTCGGKTTTANILGNILPNSKIFSQDDYFFAEDDPRHIIIPELNHVNYDTVSSLDNAQLHADVVEYVNKAENSINGLANKDFPTNGLESDTQTIVSNLIKKLHLKVVIVEGFCIFNYKPMQDVFDLMYYFTLKEDECYKRRQTRVYEPPDCPGYFEACVWPEHLKQKHEVETASNNVTYFDESFSTDTVIQKIFLDLNQKIRNT